MLTSWWLPAGATPPQCLEGWLLSAYPQVSLHCGNPQAQPASPSLASCLCVQLRARLQDSALGGSDTGGSDVGGFGCWGAQRLGGSDTGRSDTEGSWLQPRLWAVSPPPIVWEQLFPSGTPSAQTRAGLAPLPQDGAGQQGGDVQGLLGVTLTAPLACAASSSLEAHVGGIWGTPWLGLFCWTSLFAPHIPALLRSPRGRVAGPLPLRMSC